MADPIRRNPSNILLGWLDRIPLRIFVVVSGAALIGFAGIYYYLTLWGTGLRAAPLGLVDFKDCLYFSVVTFTSLGYGDITPVGWGRLAASVEVILGLSFLGVAIAKRSSARQGYYLGQLYARNAQESLQQFVIRVREFRTRYVTVFAELKAGKSPARSVSSLHLELHATLSQILSYLNFEIRNGDFLGQIPKGPVTRLLHTCSKLVSALTAVGAFRKSLHSQKQRSIAKRIIRQIVEIGGLVRGNTADPAMVSESETLLERCASCAAELQRVSDEVAAQIRMPHAPE